jgi:PKHD-type hydroxylase
MNDKYYIRKVLEKEKIDTIQRLLKIADEKNVWQDGLYSGGGKHSIKNNNELIDTEISKEINNYIMTSLDSDPKFLSFTSASDSSLNIISKTESGNYYNPHMDNWKNGDYSTTIFLSNPNDYIGGELCLYFGNDEEKKVKLDAGWAITYPTGILHRVNKVISGIRYASVFWTHSVIKDPNIRSISYQLNNLISLLEEDYKPIHRHNFESCLSDPLFVAKNLQNEIHRLYSFYNK